METMWTESLWGDEGFSALAVQKPFWETMGVVMRDTAPPLFYILGWAWGRVFGFSEVSLRSLSFLLLVGASGFTFLILRKIGKESLPALAGALLAFFSPFLFPYAFEFRMYALFAFMTLGSVYFFISQRWKGYVIFTTLALYSHHYTLFTVLGQFLWYLIAEFDWKHLKTAHRQLWPFFLVGGLYLPWIYPFSIQLARVKGSGFWLSVPSLGEISNLLYRFATGGVMASRRTFAAVLVVILLVAKQWKTFGKKWLALCVIFLMPIILSIIISYIITPIFYDRYLLSVFIGMSVLIVVGMRKWAWPALLLLLALYIYSSVGLFTHPTKRNFRDLANYVKQHEQPGDFRINYNGKAHHLWESKYYGIDAPIYTPNGPLPLYVGTAQMTDEDTIQAIPSDISRLEVFTSESVEQVKLPKEWGLEESKEFDELKVLWYTPLK